MTTFSLPSKKPTLDFYGYLQTAFEFFNNRLFDGKLSPLLFTVVRRNRVAGFFRQNGWQNENGESIHELSVNPAYFITSSPLEFYQTLVHEMCHQWQLEQGKPSKGGYHNTEWADKMRAIGLEPISANGKGTGQSVSDKPIDNGEFENACRELFLTGYRLALVDSSYSNGAMLRQLNDIIADRAGVNQNNSDNEIDNDDDIESLDNEHDNADDENLDNESENNEHVDEIVTEMLNTPIKEFYDMQIPKFGNEKNTKWCYRCSKCGTKVWGKPDINIGCIDCDTTMYAE